MTLRAEILRNGLLLTKAKRFAAKSIYKPQRGTNLLRVEKFHKSLTVKIADINGFRLLNIHPSKSNNQHIFFLHGGAFVLEPLAVHRAIIEQFSLQFGFTVLISYSTH